MVVERVGAHVLIGIVFIFELGYLNFFRQLLAHVRQKGLGQFVSLEIDVQQLPIRFESHARCSCVGCKQRSSALDYSTKYMRDEVSRVHL